MIELTWLQMAHPKFQEAVNAIGNCPNLDGHTSYDASKIVKEFDKANREIQDLRIKLCNKYGKKDEAGKLVVNEQNQIQFDETLGTQAEFEKEFQEEFKAHKVEIKVNKLDFQSLVQVRGITPRHWEFLESIVENLPDQEIDAKHGLKVAHHPA